MIGITIEAKGMNELIDKTSALEADMPLIQKTISRELATICKFHVLKYTPGAGRSYSKTGIPKWDARTGKLAQSIRIYPEGKNYKVMADRRATSPEGFYYPQVVEKGRKNYRPFAGRWMFEWGARDTRTEAGKIGIREIRRLLIEKGFKVS